MKSFNATTSTLGRTNNLFLDASDYNTGTGLSEAKGLLFPRVDLTQWEFSDQNLGGFEYPHMDGVIVYNSGEGMTKLDQGIQVPVTPGFYFFSNPDGERGHKLDRGRWKPLSDIIRGIGDPRTGTPIMGQAGDVYLDKDNGDLYTWDTTIASGPKWVPFMGSKMTKA